MYSVTAGALNLGGSVDAPSRLENGAMNHQEHTHAQYYGDDD